MMLEIANRAKTMTEYLFQMDDGLDGGSCNLFQPRRIFKVGQICPDADLVVFKLTKQSIRICLTHRTRCLPKGFYQAQAFSQIVQKTPQGNCCNHKVFDKGGLQNREGLPTAVLIISVAAKDSTPSSDSIGIRF